ncbi:thioesterase II family protein [Kutzneria buriramensis]|uniref:Surfactin synthase thioesterase subunit n=1 Tax=Kutzneria buriramensis TaxID=1045776 RepID=A0A3E0GTV2_9PSEU|nr:alpha/beta fold hydrolase [Kutzneria buriramensis]REH27631.1 surfactin synthase thioesterase subunit [Kutzneria buriramensis]
MPDWLDAPPDQADRLRLFCFHHAGGGASAFRGWRAALAPDVAVYPVQLPGREARVREPRISDLATAVTAIADALDPWLNRPYAFYGHSMGALIAHTLTSRLLATGKPLPARLLVGAFPGPLLRAPLAEVSDMSDEQLVELLLRIGGMSETVRRYPDWRAAAIALLRADLGICHGPRPPAAPALPVPIDVYTGAADPLVSRADVDAWAAHSTAEVRTHVLPGGHFFVHDAASELLDLIRSALATVPVR